MIQFTTADMIWLAVVIVFFTYNIIWAHKMRKVGEKAAELLTDKKITFRLHEGNPDMVNTRNRIIDAIDSMRNEDDYDGVLTSIYLFQELYQYETDLRHTLEDLAERVTKARRLSTV